VTIRDEQLSDHPAIASLHRTVFRGDGEATLVDALRVQGLVLVSLVAVLDENVVGHIMLSALQLKIADREVVAAALAPLAVSPCFQRKGYGSSLVKGGIEAVRAAGCEAIIVLGHPNYYRRFGFSADLTRNLIAPFRGPAFMGLEHSPGVLAGRQGSVTYPPPFRSLD
jgi:putative acetyltransferase